MTICSTASEQVNTIRDMRRILQISLFLASLAGIAIGGDILDEYVRIGLENNLSIKQREIDYRKSIADLRKARGMFMPGVTLSSRYTRADGGRTFDVPIGDLMNPVYETLNEILAWGGYDPKFPANLENESYPILPEEEQETKVRVVQPLFKPEILFNYNIQSNMRLISKMEHDIYSRELELEIRRVYFNYLKALRGVNIYRKYLELTGENLRVSRSLFDNGKVTQEAVYRAEARMAQLEGELAAAEKDSTMSAVFFNYLLGRDSEAEIDIEDEDYSATPISQETAESLALANREEIIAIDCGLRAAKNYSRIGRSAFIPGLVGVFDYGFQGENFDFDGEHDFWTASLLLEWNLFRGGQDWYSAKSGELEYDRLEIARRELIEQIKLQARDAREAVIVAEKLTESATAEVRSARAVFDIVEKKYANGMANQIEYMEAQTNLNEAEMRENIVNYELRIRLAELNRAIALDKIAISKD